MNTVKLPRNRHILAFFATLLPILAASPSTAAPSMSEYISQRARAVQAQLKDAPDGFILLAGDSHIEKLGLPDTVCGRTLVNAGVSGATSHHYTQMLQGLSTPSKVSIAVLTIGTNDALRKRSAKASQFTANVDTIIGTLSEQAKTVLVTAVPPVVDAAAEWFDPDLIESFSKTLSATCEKKPNCTFIDPYRTLRDTKRFGIAVSGAMKDGVHLDSYAEITHQFNLCNRLSEPGT